MGQCDELREEGRGGEGASRETHGNVECFVIFGGPWAAGVTQDDQGASRLLCCFLVAQSRPTLVATWTVARQAPLCMGFSRQEYWSGLPFPFSGSLPDPGIEPASPALTGRSLPLSHQGIGASY